MGPLRNFVRSALIREWRQRSGLELCIQCGRHSKDPDLLRCRSCEMAAGEAERAAAEEFFRPGPFIQ